MKYQAKTRGATQTNVPVLKAGCRGPRVALRSLPHMRKRRFQPTYMVRSSMNHQHIFIKDLKAPWRVIVNKDEKDIIALCATALLEYHDIHRT